MRASDKLSNAPCCITQAFGSKESTQDVLSGWVALFTGLSDALGGGLAGSGLGSAATGLGGSGLAGAGKGFTGSGGGDDDRFGCLGGLGRLGGFGWLRRFCALCGELE